MSKVNDTPKPRNFNVQPFERPTGYDKRMTREIPREAADNSNYAVKIQQANYHYQTPSLYPAIADENLAGRVAAVKDVVNSAHTVYDYPGENTWFLYQAATTGDAYVTFTLASGKSLKAVAPLQGTYTNTIQICTDGFTWKTLELGVDYAPAVQGFSVEDSSTGTVTSYSRYAVANRVKVSSGVSTQMYAWIDKLTNSVRFTEAENPTTTSHLWTCTITSTGDAWADTEVTPSTISQPNQVWLRGRLARGNGEACPRFNGNVDAITKVEGDLLDLLDATGRTWACGVPYQFAAIFANCSALTDASGLKFPTQVPGRGLIHRLYQEMFTNCTALVSPPSLADINVSSRDDKQAIFQGMFYNCSSMVTAPALPKVSWLPFGCYKRCFQNCTSLKSITIEGLNGIQGDALIYWMNNIPGGTTAEPRYFYHPNCGKRFRFPSGSGIPAGWTPVPELETKFYFTVQDGVGGTLTATSKYSTESAVDIKSGDSVRRLSVVTITPHAAEGYTFNGWLTIPSGFTEDTQTHVLSCTSFGYDVNDNISCVAEFTRN